MKKCNIVEDLWPLYIDGDLSESSRQFVEEHIKQCPNCQKLKQDMSVTGLKEILEPYYPEETGQVGSAENFLFRLKRKRRSLIVVITITLLLFTGAAWQFGKEEGALSYQEKYEQERKFHQNQVAAVEEISPSAQSILNKWGITFSINKAVGNSEQITIDYALSPDADSPITWIMDDRDAARSTEDLLIDEATGSPINKSGSSGQSDRTGMQRSIEFLSQGTVPNKVKLKTSIKYAFFEEYDADISFEFDYDEGKKIIPVNQEFTYRGVEFSVDTLELNEEQFLVKYRQLTPVSEVGIFQIDFAFDDRLGNVWHNFPEVGLDVRSVREHKVSSITSPSQHWFLKVHRIVQVIPGIEKSITLEGGANQ